MTERPCPDELQGLAEDLAAETNLPIRLVKAMLENPSPRSPAAPPIFPMADKSLRRRRA